MAVALPKNFSKVRQQFREPLIRNSFFIMASSFVAAGFGFFFWMIAARLYSQADVGIATALMSSMGLLILISRLGLDQSVIRFFPSRDKNKVLGTAILVPTGVALGAGLVFIAAVDIVSPELTIVKTIAPLYLLFLGAYSITWVLEGAFNALRKSEHYFALNLLYGSRILFLVPLVFLGATGIFSAFGFSFVLGLIFALLLLARCSIRPALGVDRVFLREAWQFSAGAYVAGMLMSAPNMVIPILVLHVLGAESTANYYITYAIVSILFMIPYAFTTSLFVEGSHGGEMKKSVLRTLASMFALLIPAILGISLFGEQILNLIGKDYVEGIALLRVLAFSALFVSICQTFISIAKVRNEIRSLIILSGFVSVGLLGLGYTMMNRFGLIGMGYAWLGTYVAGTLLVAAILKKKGWL
ncbi:MULTISPECIES: oligosaccharide flippase family protein [unclassified Methanoculleus]|uniref:lipopolysaccharide biosynthesis protein n=1 Tax=unclassified Methanoculleus TaxID=2619537 RepID=UPI0025E4D0E1|nr:MULTISPECIES: oligosaccharide flippase family protein [unclassified Methanoculleus]MCK9297360.1 oligosaccharide flippase family protein [Methanoculleus sp.]MDD2253376.1 oligosaccharide flippase family protein [Methanoculleus sp.]MDD2787010.1 oligosaccharide flippase family protein [Methanoculleus sp.]MDD3216372.1 oligosaccharide flippase family protein [Methanoculleus sp.]MDD4314356.1 oligosaccharide flippase family protein [Methanoculleus sp.]